MATAMSPPPPPSSIFQGTLHRSRQRSHLPRQRSHWSMLMHVQGRPTSGQNLPGWQGSYRKGFERKVRFGRLSCTLSRSSLSQFAVVSLVGETSKIPRESQGSDQGIRDHRNTCSVCHEHFYQSKSKLTTLLAHLRKFQKKLAEQIKSDTNSSKMPL